MKISSRHILLESVIFGDIIRKDLKKVMDRSDKQRIEGIVQRILDDFGDDRAINKTDLCNEPDKTAIIDVIDKLMKILYPG